MFCTATRLGYPFQVLAPFRWGYMVLWAFHFYPSRGIAHKCSFNQSTEKQFFDSSPDGADILPKSQPLRKVSRLCGKLFSIILTSNLKFNCLFYLLFRKVSRLCRAFQMIIFAELDNITFFHFSSFLLFLKVGRLCGTGIYGTNFLKK